MKTSKERKKIKNCLKMQFWVVIAFFILTQVEVLATEYFQPIAIFSPPSSGVCSLQAANQPISPWYVSCPNNINTINENNNACGFLNNLISQSGVCYADIYQECLVRKTVQLTAGIYSVKAKIVNKSGAQSTITATVYGLPSNNSINSTIFSYVVDQFKQHELIFTLSSAQKVKLVICDDRAADYTYIGSVSLTEITCKTINNCNYYNSDCTCKQCSSGIAYDSGRGVCPSAETVIPGCETVKVAGSTFACNSCKFGFTLTFNNLCVKTIQYCSIYAGGTCKVCITDYFWNGKACVKIVLNCREYNEQGECKLCQNELIVSKGLCVSKLPSQDNTVETPKITCSKGQYLNLDGKCANGNIKLCEEYSSPFGDCAKCQSGYQVNQLGQCSVVCPPDTKTQKYFVLNNECIKTDVKCRQSHSDGYCWDCQDEFQPFKGKCYDVSGSNLRQIVAASEEKDLIVKEKDSVYLIRSDGSRIYLDGPWRNKQVYVDDGGFFYERIPGDGRRYLNGPYANLNSYADSQGKWYCVTEAGKIVYF